MATRKQIGANRRNALKSTGPRRARQSRVNALRHRLRAKPDTLSEANLNEITRIQHEFRQPFALRALDAFSKRQAR